MNKHIGIMNCTYVHTIAIIFLSKRKENTLMGEVKIIYTLPTLEDHQEWACEQGCDHVRPKLYRNVYSQTWDKENGNLIEELAEHYYTCGRNHLLMVWDSGTNDYAALDDAFHEEKVNV